MSWPASVLSGQAHLVNLWPTHVARTHESEKPKLNRSKEISKLRTSATAEDLDLSLLALTLVSWFICELWMLVKDFKMFKRCYFFFTCHNQKSKCVVHEMIVKRKKPKRYELRQRENEIASPACSPFRVLGQETSSLSLRRSRRTKTPGVTSKFWHLVGRVKPSNDLCRLASDPDHDVLGCYAFQLQFHSFSVWKKCILGQRPSCDWSDGPQDLFEVALSVDCVPFDEIKILLLMYVDMCLSVLQLKAFLAAPKWEKIQ